MKKINLLLVALAATAILVSASAFAHTEGTTQSQGTSEWMDQMHEEMTSQINDKELIEAMDEMHEQCKNSMGNGS